MNHKILLIASALVAFHGKFSVPLYTSSIIHISSTNSSYSQNRSAVILVTSPKYFIEILRQIEVMSDHPKELNFLIYCKDFEPRDIWTVSYNDFLQFPLVNRAYFIQNDQVNLSLVTLNAITQNHSKKPRFETVDILNKKTLIWKNKL
jgi:hypothetical protein